MKENKFFTIILRFISIFVGLLFIFSGLIKANDPSGLAYKMGEFFEVWANKEHFLPSLMLALNKYAMAFSIMMISFEIIAGVALIIGYRFKLFSYLILALTVFFTFLTAYALFSGNIKECGCFGDCIKLQANESFMKDIILLILLLLLVIFRKKIHQAFGNALATALMIISFVLSIAIQWYAIKHLPFKDCLAYKKGNNLLQQMTPDSSYVPAQYKTILTYEKDGVKKDFDDKNFPWQDSTWKFIDSKSSLVAEAQNEPPIKDFVITNYDGNDVTQQILNYPGHVFILFIKDIHEAKTDNMNALKKLVQDAKEKNMPVIAVSASNDIETNEFKQKHQLDLSFFMIDGTVCKTAMRSNPGLMLLKNGTVLGKWSYVDYPQLNVLSLSNKDNQFPLFPTEEALELTTPQETNE
ncbi:MAG: DoxX family protein [Chitinophagaceae bacterium]